MTTNGKITGIQPSIVSTNIFFTPILFHVLNSFMRMQSQPKDIEWQKRKSGKQKYVSWIEIFKGSMILVFSGDV